MSPAPQSRAGHLLCRRPVVDTGRPSLWEATVTWPAGQAAEATHGRPPSLGLWPRDAAARPSAVPPGQGAPDPESSCQERWPARMAGDRPGAWLGHVGSPVCCLPVTVCPELWGAPLSSPRPQSAAERPHPSRPRTPGRRRPIRAPEPARGGPLVSGRARAVDTPHGPCAVAAPSGGHPGVCVGTPGWHPGPPRKAPGRRGVQQPSGPAQPLTRTALSPRT